MKILSDLSIAKIFVGFLLIAWIIILIIVSGNHALACVDEKGCLKSQCKIEWLKPHYKSMVIENSNRCPNKQRL